METMHGIKADRHLEILEGKYKFCNNKKILQARSFVVQLKSFVCTGRILWGSNTVCKSLYSCWLKKKQQREHNKMSAVFWGMGLRVAIIFSLIQSLHISINISILIFLSVKKKPFI